MSKNRAFEEAFKALTGFPPFPWQGRLYERLLLNDVPSVCDIPTGIGKTMVIPIWLLALACNTDLPRRLVYVVNRRTIVDQATDLVTTIRQRIIEALGNDGSALYKAATALMKLDPLSNDATTPLAVSTLRGEFADNEEWKSNPAKPAIVIGTVDMIGSKLLFSGYGDSRRMRPLHAGLLGCDCLFIHDEAHLTPAFGKLLRSVHAFVTQTTNNKQQATQNFGEPIHWIAKMQVLELSATHTVNGQNSAEPLLLSPEDEADHIIAPRLKANKTLYLNEVEKDGKPLQERIIDLALEHASMPCRVVVFLRKPEDAGKVADGIQKALGDIAVNVFEEANPGTPLPRKKSDELRREAARRVNILTGQIRGYERDKLLLLPAMQPFLTECIPEEAAYLVATSAAEVGMDLHADHMVCDLSTLDSMIQRLGRVNRFGSSQADVQVVHDESLNKVKGKETAEELARKATLAFLRGKRGQDSSIDVSISCLQHWLQEETVREAFSPVPEMVDLTPLLLDLWAQTSVEGMAASPEPESWLHGIQDNYPQTILAWRSEVTYLKNLSEEDLKRWFLAHPLRACERLQLPTHTILKQGKDDMSTLLKGFPQEKHDATVIVLSPQGEAVKTILKNLVEHPRSMRLNYASIILPTDVSGLSEAGFFDPKTTHPAEKLDVASRDLCRCLLTREGAVWHYSILGDSGGSDTETPPWERVSTSIRYIEREKGLKMVLKLQVEIADEFAEDDEVCEKWLVLLRPVAERRVGGSTDTIPTVQEHSNHVAEVTRKLCTAFPFPEKIREALVLAAQHHDKGKEAPRWQIAAGHDPESDNAPLAKGAVDWRKLDGYRHEAGSLQVLGDMAEIRDHPEADLILHSISTHHGWARPHFQSGAFLLGGTGTPGEQTAYEAMLRYDRLQRRFGWWGLAWLESILRRADAIASAAEQNGILEEES